MKIPTLNMLKNVGVILGAVIDIVKEATDDDDRDRLHEYDKKRYKESRVIEDEEEDE